MDELTFLLRTTTKIAEMQKVRELSSNHEGDSVILIIFLRYSEMHSVKWELMRVK